MKREIRIVCWASVLSAGLDIDYFPSEIFSTLKILPYSRDAVRLMLPLVFFIHRCLQLWEDFFDSAGLSGLFQHDLSSYLLGFPSGLFSQQKQAGDEIIPSNSITWCRII